MARSQKPRETSPAQDREQAQDAVGAAGAAGDKDLGQ